MSVSSDDGSFNLAGIPAGVYTVRINAPDFREKTIPDTRIDSERELPLGRLLLQVRPCGDPGVMYCPEVTAPRPKLIAFTSIRKIQNSFRYPWAGHLVLGIE